MKYLPDDHLAKVTYKQDNLTENVKKDNGFVKRHPQFSFATLQYMKKYNLLPDDRAQGEALWIWQFKDSLSFIKIL